MSIAHARYYYNQHFTEYDSRDWQMGIRATHALVRGLEATIGYAFVSSAARGREVSITSLVESADASFREHDFQLGADWRFSVLSDLPTRASIDAVLEIRNFTSSHPPTSDPYHSGRRDYEYGIDLGFGFDLTKSFDAELTYSFTRRDARTSVQQNQWTLADEKDFTQHRIGLRLRYLFQF